MTFVSTILFMKVIYKTKYWKTTKCPYSKLCDLIYSEF